jgi:hypothetical protein
MIDRMFSIAYTQLFGPYSCDPVRALTEEEEEEDIDHTEQYEPVYSIPVCSRDERSYRDTATVDYEADIDHTEEYEPVYSIPFVYSRDDRSDRDTVTVDSTYESRENNSDQDSAESIELEPPVTPRERVDPPATMRTQSQSKPPSVADMVMQRLSEYESIGRLSRQEYSVFRKVLDKNPGSKYHLQQITNELDKIAKARPGAISSSQSTVTDHSEELHSILVHNKKDASQRKAHVSWEDQDQSNDEEDDEEDDKENNVGPSSDSILEPADLWKRASAFDEQQLQELFVEMCFFARLGFVQPPCCLQCTYRESIHKKTPKTECQRWVVWRKDAQKLLHPNRLDGNILIVKCHVARSLLAGENVEGREWDVERKQVVLSSQL